MENHPIESLMQTAMYNIQEMIDVDTIIGEPIEVPNGTTIIPISKVTFGFASGGSDFKDEVVEEYEKEEKLEKIKTRNPFGGGAGAGIKIIPVGFLIIENKESAIPKFISIEHDCTIDKILDYVPDAIAKIEKFIYKGKCDKMNNEEDINVNIKLNKKEDRKKTKREKEIEKEYFKNETPVQSDGEDL